MDRRTDIQDLHSLHEIVQEHSEIVNLHIQKSESVDKALGIEIAHVQETHKKDNDIILEKLSLILEQTTRHNGRMSKVEAWRNTMIGALAILTIIVVPLLTWSLSQIVGIDKKVQDGTRQAIDEYNLSLKKFK